MPSETAATAPTQRDHHLQSIAEHGPSACQTASVYTNRARAEADIGRSKQVIGDGLRRRDLRELRHWQQKISDAARQHHDNGDDGGEVWVLQDELDHAARFCRAHEPAAWTPPASHLRELRELMRRCDGLKTARVQEISQQKSGMASSAVANSVAAHLE